MFILATLAVIVVIGALFVGNMQQNKRDAIVLPDAAQSTQSELQPDENEPALLEVTRENVQSIVRSLRRPQYYHQTYTITRQMNGAVSETSAELWVADTRVCAVLTTASGEKHILTDGETLYVWYAGDETVRTLAASQDATMDELIGIPTYEQVGAMPPASITDGEFITDDRYDSGQQIFAASEEGTVRRECWISLSYGLLTESILKSGGETIYDAIQTGLEILAAGDETFEDVFTLPDGTVRSKSKRHSEAPLSRGAGAQCLRGCGRQQREAEIQCESVGTCPFNCRGRCGHRPLQSGQQNCYRNRSSIHFLRKTLRQQKCCRR